MKDFQSEKGSNTILSPEEIEEQLHRVLNSPDFDATNQQRSFLNFVVSETLAGNGHRIKGYTVATRVFGRDENFDQAIDPIVSIQANKLRRSLERYYLLVFGVRPLIALFYKYAFTGRAVNKVNFILAFGCRFLNPT